jgi:hypothetical protein
LTLLRQSSFSFQTQRTRGVLSTTNLRASEPPVRGRGRAQALPSPANSTAGLQSHLDYLGEEVSDPGQAEAAAEEYAGAIEEAAAAVSRRDPAFPTGHPHRCGFRAAQPGMLSGRQQ